LRCLRDAASRGLTATARINDSGQFRLPGPSSTPVYWRGFYFPESTMERLIETLMVRSRWLLAPIYLGLSLALVALAITFFREVWHLFEEIFSATESDVVLIVLSLVDISLVGGLLVMIMLSGYENFVSELDTKSDSDKLSWLGTMDASSLKMKVAASIVAISSIHLLRKFMELGNVEFDAEMLKWYVIIHLTFVASAFAMGTLDRITKH
jgi:uncharacterized protein (TIGR00645 family)